MVSKLFSTVAAPFYISTTNIWGFQFFHILAITFFFLITIAILADMIRYLAMILICFSLTSNDVEHFLLCLLAISIFWRTIQIHCTFFFKLNLLWWHWLIKLYRFQITQFCDTVSVYCIVCLPPRVKSSLVTIYLTPFILCKLPVPIFLW